MAIVRKYVAIIIVVLILPTVGHAKVDTHAVSATVCEMLAQSTTMGGDKAKLHEAIALLNTTLAEEPENRFLLNLRSQVYGTMGDLQSSREDVRTLVALRPDLSVYLFAKCLLDEALGEPKAACMQCYNKVNELAAAELGEKKEQDIGYIIGLLMAENPLGTELAEKYIKMPTDAPMNTELRAMLRNFKREDLVPKVD